MQASQRGRVTLNWGLGGIGGRCSRKEEEESKTEAGVGIHRPYLDLANKPNLLEERTPVPRTKAPVSKGLREYLHDLDWANVWHA